MALTTQLEVEKRLQWDITAEPDAVVTSLIAAATAHMEGYVGRKLESATYTAELHDPAGSGGIQLYNWPVTAVTAVTVEGVALPSTEWLFYTLGRLYRLDSGGYQTNWNSTKRKSVAVTYTAGYLAGTHVKELAHLGSICTEVVARAFRAGAASAQVPAGVGLGGITAVQLDGSDSVTYTAANSGSATIGGGLTRFVFLMDEEKRELDRYLGLLVA